MDEQETARLAQMLQRQQPQIKARAYWNGMTQTYDVEVTGGDPRGIRVWLSSPRQVMRYAAWLASKSE